MLNKINYKSLREKDAFSAAEMLLVMLIIGFLILAMPPLVHKKFEKKVTRGEHGRYECWRDPDNNHVYDFIATEKGGPVERASMVDATGRPRGRDLGVNGVCSFNPRVHAQNASFFSMQVVGGGAGGAYPPYENSETYVKNSTTISKDVKLTHINYNVLTGTGTPSKTVDKQYSYTPYLKYHDAALETKWVRKYFPTVVSKVDVQYCAGSGHRGDIYKDGALDDTSGLSVFYGGEGGPAHCHSAYAGQLAIGNTDDSYYQAYSMAEMNSTSSSSISNEPGGNCVDFQAKNSGVFYKIDYIPPDKSLITYWPEDQLNPNVDQFSTDEIANMIGIAKDNWTTRNTRVSCAPSSGNAPTQCVGLDCSECSAYDLSYKVHYQYITDSATASGTTYAPGRYPGKIEYDVLYTKDLTIAQGEQGNSYDPDQGRVPSLSSISMYTPPMGAYFYPLMRPDSNSPNYYGPAKATATATDLFPETITMKYTYGYNTPTYGYAGKGGGFASLFLPKLSGEVQVTLGQGGAPGTSGSASQRKGGNGTDTTVWIRREGAPAGTCVSADANCKFVLSGKGGLGLYGGASGPQIKLLGADTCEFEDSGAAAGMLHRCLDRGVALFSEAEMRFSADTGFTAIPEFDSRTKTPSALNEVFRDRELKPGSGGNGGYTFIVNNAGNESVEAQNHTHFSAEYLSYMGQDGFMDAGLNKVSRGRAATVFSTSSEVTGYRCFEKNDDAETGTGAVPTNFPGMSNVKLCSPKRGMPGAVVIVW